MALRNYGDHLYAAGEGLQKYRYTVLAAQRLTWGMKGNLGPAWELVSRWERLEPPQHRTPVPEAVLQALAVLAWFCGLERWAAVTCAAFYGMARIVEILNCTRACVLLPADHLSKVYAVYIKLTASKTSGRGRFRVQHLKVDNPYAVKYIIAALSHLPTDAPLYVHGPGAFRLRWNRLLATLGFGDSSLTPGGLRGGGAVAAYHCGRPVSDVQWRMRLKNLHTLEFYLQETAALNSLMEAGPDALQVIKLVSDLFEPLSKGL